MSTIFRIIAVWKIISGPIVPMSRRGFTLIELMIVITIAAIMMVAMMRSGGGFIADMQAKQLKEKRVSDVNLIRGELLASGLGISGVTLELANSNMIASYTGDVSDELTYSYTGMIFSGASIIELVPYELTCSVSDIDGTSASEVKLSYERSNKKHCYRIITDTCKLQQLNCN